MLHFRPHPAPGDAVRRAFTLIELLVVIAVNSILAAILFPVFARARENARRASCQSNLKQLGLTMLMYSQDYDEGLMPVQSVTPKVGGTTTARWPQILAPYIKSRAFVMCPSADYSKALGSTISSATPLFYGGILESTPDSPNSAFYYYGLYPSYGYNYAYLAPPSDRPNGPDSGSYVAAGSSAQPVSLAAIDAPSSTIALADSADYGSAQGGIYAGYYVIMPPSGDWWNNSDKNIVTGHILPRHLETTNVLFVDGHVKALKLDALRDLNLWRLHKQ